MKTQHNEQDLSQYKAFPEGYVIPGGTKVIKVADDDGWVRRGSIGVSKETACNPYVIWENEDYDLDGGGLNWTQYSEELAPINPKDHPDYKEI